MLVVKQCGVALLALGVFVGCSETTTTPIASAGSAGAADGGASGTAQDGDAESGAAGDSVMSSGGVSSGGTASTSSGGMSDAGAPADSTLEPIRVIRGAQGAVWSDLTIRGVGLDEYEGKVATVRLGIPDRPPERLGSGQARIQGGAFELFFPQVWEDSLYKRKLVYIDVNDDGSCDLATDKLFADSRGVVSAALIVRGSGSPSKDDFPRSEGAESCAPFNSDWPSE